MAETEQSHLTLYPDCKIAGAEPVRVEVLDRWIAPHPRRDNVAEVRIRDFGVPVWALIGHQQATGADYRRLAHDYEIPDEAARAAVRYYELHRTAIDVRRAENAA